jgi:hypothetical protein
MAVGGMAISSQAAAGTAASGLSGDAWAADAFGSDQFSQIELTSTQLTGGQWIGVSVRMQAGGQAAYTGLYFWNGGSPELMLFRRTNGGWAQLGGSVATAPLPAGTVLEVTAAGSAISLLKNGSQVISVTDTNLTGGAPGIMAFGTAQADNWTGGNGTGPATGSGSGSSTYTVGGTASGLTGTVVLQDNGGDDLNVTSDGPFTFATPLADGASYDVTIKSSPASQSCTLTGGTGTITSASTTGVTITCAAGSGSGSGSGSYTVGGTASGLTGTVVLQDNGGDHLNVASDGPFTFATPLAGGSGYEVTVETAPAGQACNVTDGTGTIASADVTGITITCTTETFAPSYASTDANGIQTYNFVSPLDGPGPQEVRVLQPTDPAPGVAHNFLYVLPVEAGLGDVFGDGLETMATLNAQNQYNLTIIEPTFALDPWYANSSTNANYQYESFMTNELVPWVEQKLSTSGHERNWLIGFSKSGIGGQDLLLKHPDLFSLAASWDFPADMSSFDQYCCDADENYGTDANFQANYRLTPAFVAAHDAPFLANNRIWVGGYNAFQSDMTDYNALLSSDGIPHLTESSPMAHRWDSGWVPLALAGLYQDSLALGSQSGG